MKKQIFAAALLSSVATFASAFGGVGVVGDDPIGQGNYIKTTDVIRNSECINAAFKDITTEKGLSFTIHVPESAVKASADGRQVFYLSIGNCPRIEGIKISGQ